MDYQPERQRRRELRSWLTDQAMDFTWSDMLFCDRCVPRFEAWWHILILPVWAALGWSAWVDAKTGRVPNKILAPGFIWSFVALLVTAWMIGPYERWSMQKTTDDLLGCVKTYGNDFMMIVLAQLVATLTMGALIWGINKAWYLWKKHDALGMGDAKWSMLATLSFGLLPVLVSWGVAAWLALGWLGWKRYHKQQAAQVYFAPFLFIALFGGYIVLLTLKLLS